MRVAGRSESGPGPGREPDFGGKAPRR